MLVSTMKQSDEKISEKNYNHLHTCECVPHMPTPARGYLRRNLGNIVNLACEVWAESGIRLRILQTHHILVNQSQSPGVQRETVSNGILTNTIRTYHIYTYIHTYRDKLSLIITWISRTCTYRSKYYTYIHTYTQTHINDDA